MKPFKNKLAVTIVVLSVAFLGIITFSIKSNSTIISSGVGGVISPLQKIVHVVNKKVKESFEFFINFSNVKKENEELSAKNAELENKLVEYDRMKEENTRLREIFNYAQANTNYDYLGCNIIGYSGGNISNGYIIDKGLNHGVEKDMVVITSVGLVGKVTKASSNFSIVQTILNENIAVAAMVESTNETTGILQGINDNKNKNLTQLSNIPMDSAIKEGDIILTSGLGSMYPKGIRIGEVTSVEVDNVGIMKKAVVKPYVDFNKLQELFVIVPNLIIILILLLIIDNTILPSYFIGGVYPSFLFVFAMAYSIIRGKKEAVFIGIASGLLQDLFFFSGFGINLFLNTLLCLLCSKIGEGIFKENRIVPILTALLVSILKVLGVAIIFKLFSQNINMKIALLSALLNAVCMLIFYKLILNMLDKYLDRNAWRF